MATVIGDWQYLHTQDTFDAGILNTASCDLRKVENMDDVLGKVIACFRPTRTIQRIKGEASVGEHNLLDCLPDENDKNSEWEEFLIGHHCYHCERDWPCGIEKIRHIRQHDLSQDNSQLKFFSQFHKLRETQFLHAFLRRDF